MEKKRDKMEKKVIRSISFLSYIKLVTLLGFIFGSVVVIMTLAYPLDSPGYAQYQINNPVAVHYEFIATAISMFFYFVVCAIFSIAFAIISYFPSLFLLKATGGISITGKWVKEDAPIN